VLLDSSFLVSSLGIWHLLDGEPPEANSSWLELLTKITADACKHRAAHSQPRRTDLIAARALVVLVKLARPSSRLNFSADESPACGDGRCLFVEIVEQGFNIHRRQVKIRHFDFVVFLKGASGDGIFCSQCFVWCKNVSGLPIAAMSSCHAKQVRTYTIATTDRVAGCATRTEHRRPSRLPIHPSSGRSPLAVAGRGNRV